MSSRDLILESAKHLAVERAGLPSLQDIARAAGVSKSGLLHHFSSRQALLEALVEEAIAEVDSALEAGRRDDALLRVWLELSVPRRADTELYRSLATAFLAATSDQDRLVNLVARANERWESLLAAELNGAELASVARLLADGLLLGAISGSITAENSDANVSVAFDALIALRDRGPR